MSTIQKKAPELAPFIENMRVGNVSISPGYDGVFGSVSVNI
jgi:hypothetical protein